MNFSNKSESFLPHTTHKTKKKTKRFTPFCHIYSSYENDMNRNQDKNAVYDVIATSNIHKVIKSATNGNIAITNRASSASSTSHRGRSIKARETKTKYSSSRPSTATHRTTRRGMELKNESGYDPPYLRQRRQEGQEPHVDDEPAHSKMHDVVGNPHACSQCTRSFKRKQVKLFTKFISIFKRF